MKPPVVLAATAWPRAPRKFGPAGRGAAPLATDQLFPPPPPSPSRPRAPPAPAHVPCSNASLRGRSTPAYSGQQPHPHRPVARPPSGECICFPGYSNALRAEPHERPSQPSSSSSSLLLLRPLPVPLRFTQVDYISISIRGMDHARKKCNRILTRHSGVVTRPLSTFLRLQTTGISRYMYPS